MTPFITQREARRLRKENAALAQKLAATEGLLKEAQEMARAAVESERRTEHRFGSGVHLANGKRVAVWADVPADVCAAISVSEHLGRRLVFTKRTERVYRGDEPLPTAVTVLDVTAYEVVEV